MTVVGGDSQAWRLSLSQAIEQVEIECHYQPIVRISNRSVIGYEALSRFPTLGQPPDVVFLEATRQKKVVDLDAACIAVALSGFDQLPEPAYLSLNVTPAMLKSPRLIALISHHIDRERIVLEITEHAHMGPMDFLHFYGPLRNYRQRLVQLAMNDTGAGYAGLNNLVQLNPDIIKIDRGLIKGIDRSASQRSMVDLILGLARDQRSVVVAEGVETTDEQAWLAEIGIRFAQGYLFGRPEPLPLIEGA